MLRAWALERALLLLVAWLALFTLALVDRYQIAATARPPAPCMVALGSFYVACDYRLPVEFEPYQPRHFCASLEPCTTPRGVVLGD
jgi:hypothetical protein